MGHDAIAEALVNIRPADAPAIGAPVQNRRPLYNLRDDSALHPAQPLLRQGAPVVELRRDR